MTDHYDEMRVPPDPLLAEALRQRLRAHMLQLDAGRLESDAHLVPVKEIKVSLGSPTSETRNRRRVAMAAAAVVAVVGVAAIAINTMNSDDDVEPASPTATTVTPTTVAPRRETGVSESLTYTVPDGWENTGYGVIKGDPAIGMTIVYAGADSALHTSYCVATGADAYTLSGGRPRSVSHGDPVGPTIDDLVSAWANLPGVDATAASDVAIDGFDGKQIEFTVPDYNAGDCNGMFGFCAYGEWTYCESLLRDKDFRNDVSYQPLPDQHLKIWILDVDGARHMILAGSSPDTSPQDLAALDEIVASIQFGAPAAATTVAPTTVAPTTVPPTTVAARTGTYDVSGVHLTFAVPAGWVDNDSYVSKVNTDPIFAVGFDVVDTIYTDSCPSVPVDPPVGPTVDDLASAWANLPGFDATAASDITVDGFHGKQVDFTVPDYNEEDCTYGTFNLWNSVGGGHYWAQGPNAHHELWILDVNGTRLVISATSFPDTSPQDRAALDEILASIQIG
jgi:hypothetical protein